MDSGLVISHSQTLTGLRANTEYHYRVRSQDEAENLSLSPDYTFRTSTAPPIGSIGFNGLDAYADAPHHAELNLTGDWTVDAWFKDETPGGYNHDDSYILLKGDTDHNADAPYMVGISWKSLFAGERTNWTNHLVSYDLQAHGVSAGAWHHVAATMQATTRRLILYLDGVPVARGQLLALSATGNSLPLAMGHNGVHGYWHGKLDDVRVWNFARTARQIQTTYRREAPRAPAGLVGNWKFNEGGGATAVDSTGVAQNATLHGGFTWSADVHAAR